MSDMEQPTLDEALEETFAVEEPEVETPEVEPYRLGDREFTPDQLEPAVQFLEWANNNPEGWKQLQDWEEGRAVLLPADQAETFQPTYEEPYEEPQEEDLWSEDAQRQLREEIATVRSELERRIYTESASAVEDGLSSFTSKHSDLSESDLDQVFNYVVDRQVLASIPEDLPYARKQAAISDRLEEAYKVVFYDRAKSEGTRETVKDLSRRRRASSSSSSVSSPRVTPAPSNASERHQALVDEIAQAIESNS